MIRITIKGIQEAQAANQRLMAAVKPTGALGRAIQYMASEAMRMSMTYTHVDTGALKASHRTKQEGPARWRIYLDPRATNPRNGRLTSIYGPYEHNRGGMHAFYERTYTNGGSLAQRAAQYLRSSLP